MWNIYSPQYRSVMPAGLSRCRFSPTANVRTHLSLQGPHLLVSSPTHSKCCLVATCLSRSISLVCCNSRKMARPVWVDKEKQWECWLEIIFIEAKNKGEAKDMSMTHMRRMLQISANNYTRDYYLVLSGFQIKPVLSGFLWSVSGSCNSLMHILWSCIKVNKVWREIQKWIFNINSVFGWAVDLRMPPQNTISYWVADYVFAPYL